MRPAGPSPGASTPLGLRLRIASPSRPPRRASARLRRPRRPDPAGRSRCPASPGGGAETAPARPGTTSCPIPSAHQSGQAFRREPGSALGHIGACAQRPNRSLPMFSLPPLQSPGRAPKKARCRRTAEVRRRRMPPAGAGVRSFDQPLQHVERGRLKAGRPAGTAGCAEPLHRRHEPQHEAVHRLQCRPVRRDASDLAFDFVVMPASGFACPRRLRAAHPIQRANQASSPRENRRC